LNFSAKRRPIVPYIYVYCIYTQCIHSINTHTNILFRVCVCVYYTFPLAAGPSIAMTRGVSLSACVEWVFVVWRASFTPSCLSDTSPPHSGAEPPRRVVGTSIRPRHWVMRERERERVSERLVLNPPPPKHTHTHYHSLTPHTHSCVCVCVCVRAREYRVCSCVCVCVCARARALENA
jgi:hypothetical protein